MLNSVDQKPKLMEDIKPIPNENGSGDSYLSPSASSASPGDYHAQSQHHLGQQQQHHQHYPGHPGYHQPGAGNSSDLSTGFSSFPSSNSSVANRNSLGSASTGKAKSKNRPNAGKFSTFSHLKFPPSQTFCSNQLARQRAGSQRQKRSDEV